MKPCTLCKVVKPLDQFYKGPNKDGRRSRCIACLTNGRPPGPSPVPLSERYKVDPKTGCWIWQGSKARHGYGNMKWKGRTVHAHRAYYEHYKEPIPQGLHIDHLCNNKSCVNPEHLEAVTIKTNVQRSWNRTHCDSCSCEPYKVVGSTVTRQPRDPEAKKKWLLSSHEVRPDGCWHWTGGIRPDGYGRLKWKNQSTVAHRVIYEVLYGSVDKKDVIDHLCNNRSCVNPDHLKAVSQSKNIQRARDLRHCKTCSCLDS